MPVNPQRIFTDFERKARANLRSKLWQQGNPERVREIQAKYQAKPAAREKRSVWNFRNKLASRGITEEILAETSEAQGGVCAICRRGVLGEGVRGLYLDHDHTNGKARGLLCPNCNTALGMVGESLEVLQAAQEYLRHWKEKHDKC